MQTQTRVTGSGFSYMTWNGINIAWLDDFQDSGQPAVGGSGGQGGYEVVQPIGAPTPVEIATSRVLTVGTLSFTIRELWNAPAWQQLQGLATNPITGAPTNNIVDIFQAQADSSTPITVQFVIRPPQATTYRGWVYNNVTVVGISDGEHVTLGSLTMPREITALYTSKTSLVTTGAPYG